MGGGSTFLSHVRSLRSPWFYAFLIALGGAFLLPLRSVPAEDAPADREPSAGDSGQLNKAEAGKLLDTTRYSPYAGRTFPTRPLFGDTHLHTSVSSRSRPRGGRRTTRSALV